MKELIKIEVTVELEYSIKEDRKDGIETALNDVLDVSSYGVCNVKPIRSKLISKKSIKK
jgi:hypothetical protein